MKRINKAIRATRWLRTECPDCTEGAILSTIIEPIAGSTATGDVFLSNIRCAEHERTHIGLSAIRVVPSHAKSKFNSASKPAQQEERNCGGDGRTYMPDT
jgi:hypothetical protein